MHRSFHVSITDPQGANRRTLDSLDTYEQARDYATAVFDNAAPGQAVEVAHMGSVVWGPYVAGGRYKPEREVPAYYTVLIPWVPRPYATQWHCTDEDGPWAYATLTSRSFKEYGNAMVWAMQNLAGNPYTIRFCGDDLKQAAVFDGPNAYAVNIALTLECDNSDRKPHERVQSLMEHGSIRDAFDSAGMTITTVTTSKA